MILHETIVINLRQPLQATKLERKGDLNVRKVRRAPPDEIAIRTLIAMALPYGKGLLLLFVRREVPRLEYRL